MLGKKLRTNRRFGRSQSFYQETHTIFESTRKLNKGEQKSYAILYTNCLLAAKIIRLDGILFSVIGLKTK